MSITISTCFGARYATLKMSETSTTQDVFDRARDQLQMGSDSSDYSLFVSDIHDIGSKPISEVCDGTAPFVFMLKADMDALFGFMNSVLPSIVYETVRMPPKAHEFAAKVQSDIAAFERYSDDEMQAKVYSVIPEELLGDASDDEKVAIAAKWFKESFFTFVRNLSCSRCGSSATTEVGGSMPTLAEAEDLVTNVELFKCSACGAVTRFPRINSVSKLLETRVGRCGEFTNAFTAILKAIGLRVRYVCDWTDHCWTEYWSEALGRYVHVDPCENIVDRPLTYEKGWGKKLKWIVAFGDGECVDVTRRYTENIDEVVQRRQTELNESWVQTYLSFKNKQLMSRLSEEERQCVLDIQRRDAESMGMPKDIKPEELRGRISGNE